ncbi:SRPBCC family protein [Conexibacter stalactiti]|uniref:SRPBCC family protein n=1 Tax=Conexibacter stalactiti TaxID=1940611 RepID=A0ABU4HYM9_9ACTN|nr:SRPBCC family protein [Conexibacter stalactiti]MDW5598420.1 SRPBCC family protein [Conexibacter stalactiti]MEC5039062.1 SRPBCC family protein [Conexibacter stalactiti]
MIELTIETEIARPPAAVFAFVTDPAKLSSWQVNTVSAEVEGGGPLRLGTRLREVHRGPRGRELASLVEVSAYEPPRLFALRIIEGALPIDARIELEPRAGGGGAADATAPGAADAPATRMRFTAHGQPRGALRLAQPLLRRVLRRQFAADCARLKQRLEA